MLHRRNKDSVAAARRAQPTARRESSAAMLRRNRTSIFIGSGNRFFSARLRRRSRRRRRSPARRRPRLWRRQHTAAKTADATTFRLSGGGLTHRLGLLALGALDVQAFQAPDRPRRGRVLDARLAGAGARLRARPLERRLVGEGGAAQRSAFPQSI